jgi:hypothetical protein
MRSFRGPLATFGMRRVATTLSGVGIALPNPSTQTPIAVRTGSDKLTSTLDYQAGALVRSPRQPRTTLNEDDDDRAAL